MEMTDVHQSKATVWLVEHNKSLIKNFCLAPSAKFSSSQFWVGTGYELYTLWKLIVLKVKLWYKYGTRNLRASTFKDQELAYLSITPVYLSTFHGDVNKSVISVFTTM